MRTRSLSVGVALLVLTGCSSPDDPVSSPVQDPPGVSIPPQSVDDIPRDDLTQERYVVWEHAEIVGDHTIRVSFWAGTHRCFGSRYVLHETADEIAIAVFEGRLPNAPNACTEEARHASLLIETQHPVADRNIVALPESQLQP